MANAISQNTLGEILRAYAAGEQRLPSDQAVRELAAAAGKPEQAVKNDYTCAYHSAGGEGDPWDLLPPLTR